MTDKPLALGIIGHPIGHTLSPVLHGVGAKENNIALTYGAFDVDPANIAEAIAGMRALSIDGLNVTVPHKVAVMEYLDEIRPEAKKIGAVNTIVREGDRLIGYNTDMTGFITSVVINGGCEIAGKKLLVYGAGGSARAVVFGLISEGAKEVVVANRTKSAAITLVSNVIDAVPSAYIRAVGFDARNLFDLVAGADIIVNTTSLGLGDSGETPPGVEKIHKDQLVVDIVYRPLITPLLALAKSNGANTLDGLWMLIHQGADAFRLWTRGKTLPVEEARVALLNEL